MHTMGSIIDVTKDMARHGEGQHFFDGRHKPRGKKKAGNRQYPLRGRLRIQEDKEGRIKVYSAKTNSYSWLEVIRIR